VDDIGPLDLRAEATHLTAAGESWECWQEAQKYNEETITVLYVPEVGRAGIAWGADAQWTDATSVQDALERYLGVDGKEMSE
jgi:hypothetical protein